VKYDQFIKNKKNIIINSGFEVDIKKINPMLFDFQKDIVIWALKKGRACVFADCGLGKTFIQLEWAKHIGGKCLIIAPLAVNLQTKMEGEKLDIPVSLAESQSDIINGINITNYEKIHKFDLEKFDSIVLDESSILKSYTGKYRTELIKKTKLVKYKLACTATPAPNDYMELGNHAEFMRVMNRDQMLSMFFIHDSGDTQKWRLKGHAEKRFWGWVTEWAVMIRQPSDLGYNDGAFILPGIKINEHIIKSKKTFDGYLFVQIAHTLQERQQARKQSIDERIEKAAEIINGSEDPWLIWCNLNEESKKLKERIENSVEIKGSDKAVYKEKSMLGFTNGEIHRLVTKPKIAGFGMNWQHCSNVMFVGLSDSYEQYYQAVRRCWRFGQKNPVNVHIVVADTEGSVIENIKRKEKDAINMAKQMTRNMSSLSTEKIHTHTKPLSEYKSERVKGENYDLILGDSIEEIKNIEDDSIHLSLFSPPFASLYTYSDSPRDMGNSQTYNEFWDHFGYLVNELYRVLIPGRIIAFHCMNVTTTISANGYIGMRDFRGALIRLFEKKGFIYHSEVVIWKDPLVQATRTKALTLAHKQISKDATRCGQGMPDYIVSMRKPGTNPEPVAKGRGFESYAGEMDEPTEVKKDNPRINKYSHKVWQRYASPVWFDIRQTNTLNTKNAREKKDERHVCPLQLDTIERVIELWSNEGDIVFSPFMGIGSEGYKALLMNRKFTGIELKESYFRESVRNIKLAEISAKGQSSLF
tara:strand:+ start:34 stop:2295 length:2262 start_codon:yes stop_codon:yes gene_type:complete